MGAMGAGMLPWRGPVSFPAPPAPRAAVVVVVVRDDLPQVVEHRTGAAVAVGLIKRSGGGRVAAAEDLRREDAILRKVEDAGVENTKRTMLIFSF